MIPHRERWQGFSSPWQGRGEYEDVPDIEAELLGSCKYFAAANDGVRHSQMLGKWTLSISTRFNERKVAPSNGGGSGFAALDVELADEATLKRHLKSMWGYRGNVSFVQTR
ncbi:hypothetical protein LIA77_08332 [Sarocladium implicatum]|nr:hypothetical protein LIA77_08332 [Sarocladium implicatum]